MKLTFRVIGTWIGIVLGLAGCARAQQEAAAQQALANEKTVCQAAYSNPAISSILNKISINVNDITLQMRASTAHATEADKSALDAWEQARKRCYQAADAAARFNNPEVATIQRQVDTSTDSLIAELYAGKITYGEFNNKRIENVMEGSREIAAVRAQVNAQNQQLQTYRQAANCAAARAQVAREEAQGPANGNAAAFVQGMNQQLTINNACN